MTAERKEEARQKFLLGGIVVKAGLSNADRAFLLGGLLELAKVRPETDEYRRLHDIGAQAFKTRLAHPSIAAKEASEWR